MSTVFSRRAFLKYTAVAAVAVAGTSLLGGCSGAEVSVCTEVGENASNTVLKVTSTLTAVDYNAEKGTAAFHLHIKNNGRINELYVIPTNFTADVVTADGKTIPYPSSTLSSQLVNGSAQIARGKEADYTITMQNIPANVEQLSLTFRPDTKYNEYRAVWVLDKNTFAPSAGGEIETPGETTGA